MIRPKVKKKKCARCLGTWDEDCFGLSNKTDDGLRHNCLDCEDAIKAERKAKAPTATAATPEALPAVLEAVAVVPSRADKAKAAGAKGGRTTAAKHGPDHYRAAGRKGGQALKDRYGDGYFSRIAKARKAPEPPAAQPAQPAADVALVGGNAAGAYGHAAKLHAATGTVEPAQPALHQLAQDYARLSDKLSVTVTDLVEAERQAREHQAGRTKAEAEVARLSKALASAELKLERALAGKDKAEGWWGAWLATVPLRHQPVIRRASVALAGHTTQDQADSATRQAADTILGTFKDAQRRELALAAWLKVCIDPANAGEPLHHSVKFGNDLDHHTLMVSADSLRLLYQLDAGTPRMTACDHVTEAYGKAGG